ncbi:MAG: hypothetical protein EOP84_06335 [Verrucomicrobiaceae bacterium]|nr:MAG: hypothetical protein EOP84_06335 [Verrucomicrobiaceae bacterium]
MSSQNIRRSGRLSRVQSFWGVFLVSIVGFWIHIAVLPLPVRTDTGLLMRFLYLLAWLFSLIYLLGNAIFGSRSQLWHMSVFLVIGAFMGLWGGYFSAGPLGMILGAVSGAFLGPLTFVLRHRKKHGT